MSSMAGSPQQRNSRSRNARGERPFITVWHNLGKGEKFAHIVFAPSADHAIATSRAVVREGLKADPDVWALETIWQRAPQGSY